MVKQLKLKVSFTQLFRGILIWKHIKTFLEPPRRQTTEILEIKMVYLPFLCLIRTFRWWFPNLLCFPELKIMELIKILISAKQLTLSEDSIAFSAICHFLCKWFYKNFFARFRMDSMTFYDNKCPFEQRNK